MDSRARRGAACWLGFWFGLGLYGAGVSWVYVSLHQLRRHARAARRIRHRGVLRLPRALPGGGGLAAGARAGAGRGARLPAHPGGVGAVRVAAGVDLHRLSVACARLRGGRAGRCRVTRRSAASTRFRSPRLPSPGLLWLIVQRRPVARARHAIRRDWALGEALQPCACGPRRRARRSASRCCRETSSRR